jgi:hypothetical protein
MCRNETGLSVVASGALVVRKRSVFGRNAVHDRAIRLATTRTGARPFPWTDLLRFTHDFGRRSRLDGCVSVRHLQEDGSGSVTCIVRPTCLASRRRTVDIRSEFGEAQPTTSNITSSSASNVSWRQARASRRPQFRKRSLCRVPSASAVSAKSVATQSRPNADPSVTTAGLRGDRLSCMSNPLHKAPGDCKRTDP